MNTVKKQLLITKNDYEISMACIKGGAGRNKFNRKDAEELELELKNAKLVSSEELPDDCVRLNSTVTIKDEIANKIMQLTVVTPERADIHQRKISILSPIGTALIGFQKGDEISWEVPAGKKVFSILTVENALPQHA